MYSLLVYKLGHQVSVLFNATLPHYNTVQRIELFSYSIKQVGSILLCEPLSLEKHFHNPPKWLKPICRAWLNR